MIRVSVALALPQRQEIIELELDDASTAADALDSCGLVARLPQGDLATMRVGIWSRPCAPETRLRDGDRVEVYRPLQADAKEMRRQRARLKPSPRSRSGP